MKKMDYTIGFQAGRTGRTWTATALTDRAKGRTPEPVMFVGSSRSFGVPEELAGGGLQVFRRGLVDPEQKLVKNRYFVIGGDGQLTPSGEDNGPRDTVWEVGDVMPGNDRNAGTEACHRKHSSGTRGARKVWLRPRVYPPSTPGRCRGLPLMPPIPPFDPAKPCPCGLHGKSYGDCCRDKGIMLPGTRCCEERLQGWCRGL